MKLTTEDTQNLQNILTTCAIAGIDSIIIDDGLVRGVNDAKSCAIISNFNIPKFPQKIGLSRLGSLKSRLDLFAGNTSAIIDAKETERGEINALEITAGRNKVQFRCTSALLIKAPKQINDNSLSKVFISKDELKMVTDAIRVMSAKKVVLSIRKNLAVAFELSDATNDAFKIDLETPAELLGDESADSVVHYYPADVFLAVMKALVNEFTTFTVGTVGTIKVSVNGHELTMLPVINEDGEEE